MYVTGNNLKVIVVVLKWFLCAIERFKVKFVKDEFSKLPTQLVHSFKIEQNDIVYPRKSLLMPGNIFESVFSEHTNHDNHLTEYFEC